MKVFKFGGASVRNATTLRNVASILKDHKQQLLVVVSAMGKTTNMLERIVAVSQAKQSIASEIERLKAYHYEITDALFKKNDIVRTTLENFFERIEKEAPRNEDYDQVYDQVVSMGEVISSFILSHFLSDQGIENEWIDARQFISTDNNFREGKVDWDKTKINIQKIQDSLKKKNNYNTRLYRFNTGWPHHNTGARRIGFYGCYFCIVFKCRVSHHLERCAGRDEC